MKAHIGIDGESDGVHAQVATTANVSDVSPTRKRLCGERTEKLGNAGYKDVDQREENEDNHATWHVAMKRGWHMPEVCANEARRRENRRGIPPNRIASGEKCQGADELITGPRS